MSYREAIMPLHTVIANIHGIWCPHKFEEVQPMLCTVNDALKKFTNQQNVFPICIARTHVHRHMHVYIYTCVIIIIIIATHARHTCIMHKSNTVHLHTYALHEVVTYIIANIKLNSLFWSISSTAAATLCKNLNKIVVLIKVS